MSATLIHHGHIRLIKKANKYGDVIIALTICNIIIPYNPNSIILIIICMLFKKRTMLLKFSAPVNNTKLLNRWNNKKIDKNKPEMAI